MSAWSGGGVLIWTTSMSRSLRQLGVVGVALLHSPRVAHRIQLLPGALADRDEVRVGIALVDRDELRAEAQADDRHSVLSFAARHDAATVPQIPSSRKKIRARQILHPFYTPFPAPDNSRGAPGHTGSMRLLEEVHMNGLRQRLTVMVLGALVAFLAAGHLPGGRAHHRRDPPHVAAGHFSFAPLEVSYHHVTVAVKRPRRGHHGGRGVLQPEPRAAGRHLHLSRCREGAHIDRFSMDIGGKMMDAELLPADKARAFYEDIVRRMKDPALLEYAGRGAFKLRVYPIEPLAGQADPHHLHPAPEERRGPRRIHLPAEHGEVQRRGGEGRLGEGDPRREGAAEERVSARATPRRSGATGTGGRWWAGKGGTCGPTRTSR